MSRRTALALLGLPFAALALATAAVTAAPADDASSAQISTYESPAGDTYFALSVPAVTNQQPAFDHDVVVLFDTSASQTGAYRDDALEAFKVMLANLGPDDRVQVLAVDLKAVPMTTSFVAPHSDAMKALDGVPVDSHAIPLADDGGTHQVRLVLGAPRAHQAAL